MDFCIDIGPKTILKNLSYTNSIKAKVYAYDNTAEKVKIGNLLMGLNEDETQKRLNFIKACLTLAISVKNRNFMENEYLQGVIEPYRNIEQMCIRDRDKYVLTGRHTGRRFKLGQSVRIKVTGASVRARSVTFELAEKKRK